MRPVFLTLLSTVSCLFAAPKAVYLTLPEDSAHSMSVHWIEKESKESTLFYQKEGETEWKKIEVFSHQQLLDSPYSVEECLIKNLEESSYYSFYFEGDTTKHLFRTLPSQLNAPLTIAVGGDLMESSSLYRKMNKVAAEKNPDCVVLGGDLAYACGKGLFPGKHGSVTRWVDFFKGWYKTMRGEKGRLIPVLAVVGNHDVTSADHKEEGKNAMFLAFFPTADGKTYKAVDIAGSLCLVLLDTGHIFPIEKQQTIWLEESLEAKQKMLWTVPIYHVAGYPSTYLPSGKIPSLIRKYWAPLFEKYGVKLAFEHHNHAFKRTYPLLKEKVDPAGIVYMGDGGWGAPPRELAQQPYYLEKTMRVSSFSLLTVSPTSLKVEVFDIKGQQIDTWSKSLP